MLSACGPSFTAATELDGDMRKVVFAITLGLVCPGCFSREAPEVAAAVSPVNSEVEVARLVRTLDISTHLQDSARAHAARQIARGLPPKTALEQWIAEQRDRGAVIRCKSEIPPTAECIART
jgi:hypothetical protein